MLNARRHRSGIELENGVFVNLPLSCSTPEGIEAGSSTRIARVAQAEYMCSTPEGIEAGSETVLLTPSRSR